MTRWPAMLLAVVVTTLTVPVVLHWGPPGVFVSMAGFGGGYGLGLLVERLTDHKERYP